MFGFGPLGVADWFRDERDGGDAPPIGAPLFDDAAPTVPPAHGPVNPFPMLGYVDSADSAPPMPTSLDPNAPRKIPGMGGTPPLANEDDLKAITDRSDAEKLLKSKNGFDASKDAEKALDILVQVPEGQRGKVIDGLDDKAFENLLERIPHDQRERFATLVGGSKNPERKLRLWAETHMATARNNITRKKGDIGGADAESDYEISKLTSGLSEKDQEKADEAWEDAHSQDPEVERTKQQERNLTAHNRRITQVTHTKQELDGDVGALLADAKAGKLTLEQVDALRERKDMEYAIEAKHNVDLTSTSFTGENAKWSRHWSKDELTDVSRVMDRLPADHVNDLDGLETIHRKPSYDIWSGVGGSHSGGTIDITDAGASTSKGYRHGGDLREGVSDDYRKTHGDKISTLEFVLTHEIGHDVADTDSKAFEKFKKAAGWSEFKAADLTTDNVTAEDLAKLEGRRKNPNGASSTLGGDDRTYSPNGSTTDTFWGVDRTAIPSDQDSAPDVNGRDSWAYAKVNPQEHFAEFYAKAIHVPHKLHDEMVTRPAAAADAARQAVAAQQALIDSAANDPARAGDLPTLRAELAKRKAAATDAERSVQQRGDQFSVMRNDVFQTDKAVSAASARLAARNVSAAKIRTFEQQAAVLSTPDQVATLEASL